jgi:invasion protein IalB
MLPILAQPAAAQDAAPSALPGGATTLNESHGDWTVSCAVANQGGTPGKICVLAQQQTAGQGNQRLLAVELRPREATVEGTLVLPFGLALDKGVTLQVDDGPAWTPLRFRTCLPGGCIVDLAFDAKTLPLLRKGTTLKIKAVADGGRDTQLAVSLKGFPSALDRTIALAK